MTNNGLATNICSVVNSYADVTGDSACTVFQNSYYYPHRSLSWIGATAGTYYVWSSSNMKYSIRKREITKERYLNLLDFETCTFIYKNEKN